MLLYIHTYIQCIYVHTYISMYKDNIILLYIFKRLTKVYTQKIDKGPTVCYPFLSSALYILDSNSCCAPIRIMRDNTAIRPIILHI